MRPSLKDGNGNTESGNSVRKFLAETETKNEKKIKISVELKHGNSARKYTEMRKFRTEKLLKFFYFFALENSKTLKLIFLARF